MSGWFSRFAHVGCAVTNRDAAIDRLAEIGIRPFGFYEFPPFIGMPTLRGKLLGPDDVQGWVPPKGAWIGGPEVEILQGDEGTPYWDFIHTRGEGFHHLAFVVDDLDSAITDLSKKNMNVVYSGKWEGGGFAYFESDALRGMDIELFQNVDRLGESPDTDPAFRSFQYAGIVVPDLDKTLRFLEGLGFNLFWPSMFAAHGLAVSGNRVTGGPYKRVAANLGEVRLELIQPVDGRSHYGDFLETTGGGIHHLAFVVDRIEEQTARLERLGSKPLLTGKWKNRGLAQLDLNVGGFVVDFVGV
jgi:catechol 2,3-dioxygenase-like lactoylglutathione lyase family enzyme